MPFDPSQHHLNSSLRENIIEHLFIGEMLKLLWRRGVTDCEILKSEFDGYGYDLVVSVGKLTRHLQMKSGNKNPTRVSVNLSLAAKQSGCVLFVVVNDDLEFVRFFWLGDEPGAPLPDIKSKSIAKRTTRNKQGDRPERENHRELKRIDFTELSSFEEVVDELVGLHA
ncbi:MAG: hypothetical protein LJE67_09590 [Salaquimonas sp.]|nr:hypothetical protein [Salaquimonas sp.]